MTAHVGWAIDGARPANGSNIVGLATLEMRATIGGADQCTGGAAYGPGWTSPANAFDGNAATNATSAAATWLTQQRLGYLFAAPVSIGQLMLKARNDASWGQVPDQLSLLYTDDGTGATGWTLYCDFGARYGLWNAQGQTRLYSGIGDAENAAATIRSNVLYGAPGDDAASLAATIRTNVLTGGNPDRIAVGSLRTNVLAGARGDDTGVSIGSLRVNVLYTTYEPIRPQLF